MIGKVVISQSFAPQIWNNVGVSWNIDNHFAWRNNVSYNVLLSSDYPWDELTFSSTGVYKFERFFEATLGVYTARARQTQSLRSYEVRPFIGFRAATNNSKRWYITNLSRFEMRQLFYSDANQNLNFRFRNRTYVALSLNKSSMDINTNRLFIFGYFEAFFNFGQEVRERFFDQFKYKLGLAYRISPYWGVNLGVIYQDAKDNVTTPSQLPTNLITNYVIDWGVVYIIPASGKPKNEKQAQ